MGLLTRFVQTTTIGAGASIGGFFWYTRNCRFDPSFGPSPADSVFSLPNYKRQNPSGNPTLHDYCVQRVPLSKIKPDLLADEGALTTEFCRGVWSGLGMSYHYYRFLNTSMNNQRSVLLTDVAIGYRYQRRYLEKKYRGPKTSHQLWDVSSLATSDYPVGAQITDHFEVVRHDPEHIVVRCGDSPLKTGVRPSDGLFEISTKIRKEEGYVEFGLKSVFFKGEGKATSPPMPAYMEWLHKQYTKVSTIDAVSQRC